MSNYLMLNNKKIELTADQVDEIKRSFGLGSVCLKYKPVGDIAKVGDLEFVVLEHNEDGTTALLLKGFWKTVKFDDNSNNYSESDIRKDLNENFYKHLSDIVGSENIVKHAVDLTSDDGRTDYGSCEDYISLPTCDMYRKYVHILDKHRPDSWWWSATAYSTKSNGYDFSVRCVGSGGALYYDRCRSSLGVRPFCILKSNIFVSE